MKIAIADNNGGKFTSDLINHWEVQGHEVRFEPGASEHLAQWADLYYLDTWDNNIHYLYKLYHGQHDDMPADWDNNKKPQVVVRVLDWEAWIGLVRDQAIIDWVDKTICIAPHMEKKLRAEADWKDKLTLIWPGVNLDHFTLKTRETDGFQIGMVLGDMWWPKNHMGGLDIFATLHKTDNRFRLHIRGQHEGGGGGEYWKQMYEHYLDSRGIRDAVTLYPRVNDMNEWLEGIDVLLHPGMKEAFCYAVGEAMAKGIPAAVNQFYGSEEIWPARFRYATHEEAVRRINILSDFKAVRESEGLWGRGYIEARYDAERMFADYDKLLNL
jgi:glycosyltransferase involved in cell wall biosynthesis